MGTTVSARLPFFPGCFRLAAESFPAAVSCRRPQALTLRSPVTVRLLRLRASKRLPPGAVLGRVGPVVLAARPPGQEPPRASQCALPPGGRRGAPLALLSLTLLFLAGAHSAHSVCAAPHSSRKLVCIPLVVLSFLLRFLHPGLPGPALRWTRVLSGGLCVCPGGSELSAPLCPRSHALRWSLLAALKSHISLLESLLFFFFSSSLLAFLPSLLTNQFLCFLSLTFHGAGFLGVGSPCRPLLSGPELARVWVSTLHRLLPAATPEHVMCLRVPWSGGWPTGARLPRGGALPPPHRLQHSSAFHNMVTSVLSRPAGTNSSCRPQRTGSGAWSVSGRSWSWTGGSAVTAWRGTTTASPRT